MLGYRYKYKGVLASAFLEYLATCHCSAKGDLGMQP